MRVYRYIYISDLSISRNLSKYIELHHIYIFKERYYHIKIYMATSKDLFFRTLFKSFSSHGHLFATILLFTIVFYNEPIILESKTIRS